MADLGTHDRSVHATTSADASDTITISGNASAVEVVNRDGAAEVFFNVNEGAIGALGEAGTEVLPAAAGASQTYIVPRSRQGSTTVVNVRASAATKISVFRR